MAYTINLVGKVGIAGDVDPKAAKAGLVARRCQRYLSYLFPIDFCSCVAVGSGVGNG